MLVDSFKYLRVHLRVSQWAFPRFAINLEITLMAYAKVRQATHHSIHDTPYSTCLRHYWHFFLLRINFGWLFCRKFRVLAKWGSYRICLMHIEPLQHFLDTCFLAKKQALVLFVLWICIPKIFLASPRSIHFKFRVQLSLQFLNSSFTFTSNEHIINIQ